MKKITLLFVPLLLTALQAMAQVTTGEVIFAAGFSAEVFVDDTEVTLTLTNPENRWMGVGFGVQSMTVDGDVVTYDSTGFNDRRFIGVGGTPPTDTQDWTVVSDVVTGGERVVVATRPLAGSDATDYTFDPNDSSIMLVWARGSTLTFGGHGQGNRGATTVGFSLSSDDFAISKKVRLYPNPVNDVLHISSPGVAAQDIAVYSVVGQLVLSKNGVANETELDVSSLASGVYIMQISTSEGQTAQRFVKQ